MMNWLTLSVLSGLCAALNGLFAKLVTNAMSRDLADRVAAQIPGEWGESVAEWAVRATFFLLNVAFNAVMWGLFTVALTRGSSATKVSVVNTSSNFMLTALLGSLIFSERLPPLWFLGATLLICGNVIIGRRDNSSTKAANHDEYTPINQHSENEEEGEGTAEGQGRLEILKRAGRDRLRADFGSDTEGGTTTGRETPGTTENEEDEDDEDE